MTPTRHCKGEDEDVSIYDNFNLNTDSEDDEKEAISRVKTEGNRLRSVVQRIDKKPPGKGRNNLKSKRFAIKEIKKADDGYEDDIYESKSFDHFKDLFPDSPDCELSCLIKTPKLASLLTPGIHCKTPAYYDCFSPTEYAVNRKIAEEYIYRNRKKKTTSQVVHPVVWPEKKRLNFCKVLNKACEVAKKLEKLTVDSTDEEDLYFNEDF